MQQSKRQFPGLGQGIVVFPEKKQEDTLKRALLGKSNVLTEEKLKEFLFFSPECPEDKKPEGLKGSFNKHA